MAFGRSKRPSLSQSLSFPAKGRFSDPMRRSIEVQPTRAEAVKPRRNAAKDESKVGNEGSFRSVEGAGKAATSRSSTLDSLPSVSHTMPGKQISADESEIKPESDALAEKSLEHSSNVLPVREEEDARLEDSSKCDGFSEMVLAVDVGPETSELSVWGGNTPVNFQFKLLCSRTEGRYFSVRVCTLDRNPSVYTECLTDGLIS